METPSLTFTPEQLNTYESPILQENPLKTLSSLQYLTIYCSMIAQKLFLVADSNKFKLLLRESLFIKCNKPILNRMIKLFSLNLTDQDDSFISIII